MASIRFYPEKRKNESGNLMVKNVPLLLFFHFHGKRMQLYTGERINFSDWDAVHEQMLPSHPGYIEINRYLSFLANRVMQIYRESKLSGSEPEINQLRILVKESLRKSQTGFFDALIRFIEENHSGWTLSTYRKVKTVYNHLHSFARTKGETIEFNLIDRAFLDKLVNYFRMDCGHIDSTIRKNMEVLFWFFNWAGKKGICSNQLGKNYVQNEFPKTAKGPSNLHLSMDELALLLDYKLSNKKEQLARDVFCLVCYTGLNIQEMRTLKPEHVHEQMIWIDGGRKIRTVPLNEKAASILDRYIPVAERTVFSKLYAHKVNRLIKGIGKTAGLERNITLFTTKNRLEHEMNMPLYQCLTLSMARKTFLYLALDLNFNDIALMDIAGYNHLKTIEGYKQNLEKLKRSEMQKFNKV